jgi:hypothetical protein
MPTGVVPPTHHITPSTPPPNQKHNIKTCHYHRHCCLFCRCLCTRQPVPQALPPCQAPDNDDDNKETTVRRYPTEQLHDPGSNRALCSVPLPPRHPGQRGQQRCGRGGPRPDFLLRWVPRGFDTALVVGIVVAIGGRRGKGGRRGGLRYS